MMGIQEMAVQDLFNDLEGSNDLDVTVSFFEIYGGRCQDLLNERHRLIVREVQATTCIPVTFTLNPFTTPRSFFPLTRTPLFCGRTARVRCT